jgi:hypothetical protein
MARRPDGRFLDEVQAVATGPIAPSMPTAFNLSSRN